MTIATAELCHYPTELVQDLLGISESTLRRTTRLLREVLSVDDFDKPLYDRGYTAKSYQALQKFFLLRSQGMSPERAAEYLRIYGV